MATELFPIPIKDGPSKFDLMTGLFVRNRKFEHTVWFKVEARADEVGIPDHIFDGKIEAVINGCRRISFNDNSGTSSSWEGNSWEVEGFYYQKGNRPRRFKAKYSTLYREGTIDLDPVPTTD